MSQSPLSQKIHQILLRLELSEDIAIEELSPRNGTRVTENKVSGKETRKRFTKFAVINNKNKVIIHTQLPIRSEESCIKGTAEPPV
jgi:hypothetical protein